MIIRVKRLSIIEAANEAKVAKMYELDDKDKKYSVKNFVNNLFKKHQNYEKNRLI
jgi:hypothetical protein